MTTFRRLVPWLGAALACGGAILIRQFLIQPPEIAQRCDASTLSLWTPGPWWCGLRAAAIMTYAWGGLFYACLGLTLVTLLWRRLGTATATLAVGLVAIVWYNYEPGAVAITIGALILARRQHRTAAGQRRSPTSRAPGPDTATPRDRRPD